MQQAQVNLFLFYKGRKAAFWLFVATMNGNKDAIKAYNVLKKNTTVYKEVYYLIGEAEKWLQKRNHFPDKLPD